MAQLRAPLAADTADYADPFDTPMEKSFEGIKSASSALSAANSADHVGLS